MQPKTNPAQRRTEPQKRMATPNPNALQGHADWIRVQLPEMISSRSFVSGNPQSQSLQVRYFYDGTERLQTRAWFGPDASGPPGHAHGGSQAAVLDEMLGSSSWMTGNAVVAGELTVSFRNMLPLGTVAHGQSWVERIDGRKIFARGTLTSPDGAITYSEGHGTFIILGPDKFNGIPHREAKALRQRTHERWQQQSTP